MILVDFTINGTDIMKNIGAESIVYYKWGTFGWEYIDQYDADDTDIWGEEMSVSDAPHYGTTIRYQGEPNQEYLVTVTVYAEDYDGGYDSRSKSFTVET